MSAVITYKWLKFIHVKSKTKTHVYQVRHKDSDVFLGYVKWYAQWRQYCFYPEPDCIYAVSCLKDTAVFIDKLMQERKKPTRCSTV